MLAIKPLPFKPDTLSRWFTRTQAAGTGFAGLPWCAYTVIVTIDLDKARKRLAEKRSELVELSELSEDARAPVELDQQAVGRLSRMDALQNQAMQQATERARKHDLVRIEMAERRLTEGDYGYCEECGEEIPDGRLAIDPMAERCVGCAGR